MSALVPTNPADAYVPTNQRTNQEVRVEHPKALIRPSVDAVHRVSADVGVVATRLKRSHHLRGFPVLETQDGRGDGVLPEAGFSTRSQQETRGIVHVRAETARHARPQGDVRVRVEVVFRTLLIEIDQNEGLALADGVRCSAVTVDDDE